MVGFKRPSAKQIVIMLLIMMAAIIGALYYYFGNGRTTFSGDRAVFRGKVEKYDVTPTFTDGPIAFVVDGKSIDIGGGLRAQQRPWGNIDEKATEVGKLVEVRARVDRSGGEEYLTIYDCTDCYVKAP